VKTLPPGVYTLGDDPERGRFIELEHPAKGDDLLRFSENEAEWILSEIEKFWSSEKYFEKFHVSYKRGILLHGKPGTGKSSLCRLVLDDVVARGGIAVRFGKVPYLVSWALKVIREVQPSHPIVVLIEDIEEVIEEDESEVLNIIDGLDSVKKVLFLATTNDLASLPERIKNRPSRFDYLIEVKPLSEVNRTEYLKFLFKKSRSCSDKTIEQWTKDTDGFTISHMKELYQRPRFQTRLRFGSVSRQKFRKW
jgi:SpoVK/Ycf46/Vps4 family AAA+-type ATPase